MIRKPSCSPFGLPVHVGRSRDLHCPLRRGCRRDRASRATQASRSLHLVAFAHRHLLRARRQGECSLDSFAPARSACRPSRLILRSCRIQLFDRKPAAEKPWSAEPHRRLKLWIYDLRTNKHFTLKENPLKRADLDDFLACYNPKNRHERKESERFKSFTYEELTKRDP